MKQPMIALTARNQSEKPDNPIWSDNRSYSDYVRAGGGLPMIVTAETEQEAQKIAEVFDGLLITGGEDCDPKYYNEPNTHSEVIQPDIDESDFMLYRAFVKAGKPVLGICRGIQVIGVCEGASLIQDIPTEFGTQHGQNHCQPPIPNDQFCHEDSFMEDSGLYDIFGKQYGVNSFHHQALRSVPEGFTLTARSEEGIIEGIEKDHVIGVQWHPERLLHDPKHVEIIRRWIKLCSSC
ncbi:MAG: gamma-glutamyl-gamma-aminobutyrate hydrolase family protein [Bulleidia sp.]